jgi:hypothetical protein
MLLKLIFLFGATSIVKGWLLRKKGVKNYEGVDELDLLTNFKRNIRKFHFRYQEDELRDEFWVNVIKEINIFLREALNIKKSKNTF